MNKFALMSALCGLFAAACGMDSGAPMPNIAEVQELEQGISDALERHCEPATLDMTCAEERDRHAAELEPMLERMAEMCAEMDACMGAMGHADAADMMGTSDTMAAALDAHTDAVCASTDGAVDQTERQRYCEEMDALMQSHMSRTQEVNGMMGDMSMMSGGTCHD